MLRSSSSWIRRIVEANELHEDLTKPRDGERVSHLTRLTDSKAVENTEINSYTQQTNWQSPLSFPPLQKRSRESNPGSESGISLARSFNFFIFMQGPFFLVFILPVISSISPIYTRNFGIFCNFPEND